MRNLGPLLVTKEINQKMEESLAFLLNVKIALDRFSRNDWGKTCKDDAKMNFMALEYHEQVLGVYNSPMGDIWLITNFYPRDYYIECFGPTESKEESLPVTTVLFPHEY